MICISGFSTISLTSISRPLRFSSPQVYSKMLDHIRITDTRTNKYPCPAMDE